MTDSDKSIPFEETWRGLILVVDDEETARRSLTDILRLEGYQVESAGSASQAIEKLEQRSNVLQGEAMYNFDVIILDLRMPIEEGENQTVQDTQAGIQVLQYAAEHASNTQVILLTAHGSLETAIEALRLSALDYLLKPASPQQILASVDKACEKKREILRLHKQRSVLASASSIAVEMSQALEKLEGSLHALRSAANAEGVHEQENRVEAPASGEQGGPGLAVPQGNLTNQAGSEARIFDRSLLERRGQAYHLGDGLMIDLTRREIWQNPDYDTAEGDQPGSKASPAGKVPRISLTPTEGKLMQVFSDNPGKVFSHRELVALVQGYETSEWEAPEVLRPLISRLRRKLESFPNGRKWIRSIRGTGYVFEVEMERG